MPLRVHIDVGHRPDLNADALLPIVRQGLDYEVLKPGRFQVPDLIVKRSDSDGAAIQILQQRLRHRTVLRVYPIAPSVSKRSGTPVGFARQVGRSQPLVDEVVAFIRSSDALSAGDRAGS